MSSGFRPPLHQNNGEVIDLCDSDEEDAQIPRRSLGSTEGDAICLLSDGDNSLEARGQPGGTVEEPITFSDGINSERAGQSLQPLQWMPRFPVKTEEEIELEDQPAARQKPLGTSSNAICIESDSDEDNGWKQNSTNGRPSRIAPSRIAPFRRGLASPFRKQATGLASPLPRKTTARKKAAKALTLDDSSDDEAIMQLVFARRRKRLLEANAQAKKKTCDSGESDDESNSSSNDSIPLAAFSTSQHEKTPSTIPKSIIPIDQCKEKASSTSKVKPPPTRPRAIQKGTSSAQETASPLQESIIRGGTHGKHLATTLKTALAENNTIQKGTSSSQETASPLQESIIRGGTHGKHLATNLKTPLAENRNLDFQGARHPESGISASRQHQSEKEHTAPDSTVSRLKPSIRREDTNLQSESLHDGGSSGVGRISPSSESKSSTDSDECCFDDVELDEAFKGGVDDPLDKFAKAMDPSELELMSKIEHLCSFRTSAETSLPMHKFSVHGDPDDIIYDFELHVKTSKIPNSGRGVFLTFVGARELKPSRKRWGDKLVQQRPYRHLRSFEPLTATHPNGFGISVTLQGKHLHGPYNCRYLLPTLQATIPGSEDTIKVRFSNYEDPYCAEELAGMRKEDGRIGFLELYTEADYAPAPRRTFSSLHANCGAIEIDRYGPFQPSDRKIWSHFDVKGFIFSNIPNEWCFEVEECLNGQQQMVDITDDVTGEPHKSACEHIPMYVNEVGHDKTLIQSVHALLSNDDRSVLYYIAIAEPLRQGDTIELLVAYKGFYEEVRKRKGYALSNLNGSEKSDDHFGTFLKRNFEERNNIKDIIAALSLMDLYLMIDWLEPFHAKLAQLVDDFIPRAKTTKEGDSLETCPLAQQFVSLRRLSWISKLLQKQLDILKKTISSVEGRAIIDQSSQALRTLKWTSWQDLISVLEQFPDTKDSNGKNIKKVFEAEIVEEKCYAVKKRIVEPMEESLWCEVSMRLIRSLCIATAKALWKDRGADEESLFKKFMQIGVQASLDIRRGSDARRLAFFPKFKGSAGLKLKDNAFPRRSGTAGEVMTKLAKADNPDCVKTSPELSNELLAIPIPIENVTEPQIQETWYLCWQVIYVIDSFAQRYLGGSLYSLEKLCSALHVDANTVSAAIRSIKYERQTSHRKNSKRKAPSRDPGGPKKKPRKMKAKNPLKGRRGPSESKTFFWDIVWACLARKCGWQLERGNRPVDFYAHPPGVARGHGFKNRIDFFDSAKHIMAQVRSNPKWCNLPAVKEAVKEYDSCNSLYEEIKGSKSMPTFKDKKEMNELCTCRTAGCNEQPAATWASNLSSGDKWNMCENCQLKDFGGWPEGGQPER